MHDHFDLTEASELESLLGYRFENINLLKEALSHPSLKQIDSSASHVDYERRELLGDSILSFIIVGLLFRKFSDLNEGDIAKITATVAFFIFLLVSAFRDKQD